MTKESLIDRLINYLNESTSPWHAVNATAKRLEETGFSYVDEGAINKTKRGKFYTTRNNSSIIAWVAPDDKPQNGIRMIGSHTDSPAPRLKPNPLYSKNGQWQLAVEPYGGMLQHTWFDRDLSLSGRIVTKKGEVELIDIKEPIATIPSLAIHLNNKANRESTINAQLHLPPVIGNAGNDQLNFNELLAQVLELDDEILDFELGLYDCQSAAVIGIGKELLASARLDNLLSLFCSLEAISNTNGTEWAMLISTDHEEIGSTSHCGAAGPFLVDVLKQLTKADHLDYQQLIRNSILLSADNTHAIHPNFSDKHDNHHAPILNNGLVIKVNHNQRYATNAVTSAFFRNICDSEDIPVSSYVARSDMGCGSTIGPLTSALTGLATVDIGIPQWAMHSIRETAGIVDIENMQKAMRATYNVKKIG